MARLAMEQFHGSPLVDHVVAMDNGCRAMRAALLEMCAMRTEFRFATTFPERLSMPIFRLWGAYVRKHMKGTPVVLDAFDANRLIDQFQETAAVRKWSLQAASVMFNHTHIVVSVSDNPEPNLILEIFKRWSTRTLKRHREVPPNGGFFTVKGSKRKLPDNEALAAGVVYVIKKQPNPLAVFHAPEWREILDAYDLSRQ